MLVTSRWSAKIQIRGDRCPTGPFARTSTRLVCCWIGICTTPCVAPSSVPPTNLAANYALERWNERDKAPSEPVSGPDHVEDESAHSDQSDEQDGVSCPLNLYPQPAPSTCTLNLSDLGYPLMKCFRFSVEAAHR